MAFSAEDYQRNRKERKSMKTNWKIAVRVMIFMLAMCGDCSLWAQDVTSQLSVLHIQQSQTVSHGSQNGRSTFLAMYHVLDGAKSPADILGLKGTLSLKNYDPTFSEVLWLLVTGLLAGTMSSARHRFEPCRWNPLERCFEKPVTVRFLFTSESGFPRSPTDDRMYRPLLRWRAAA